VHAKAAAGGKDGKYGAMRRVLGKQRGCDGATIAHDLARVGADDGFAAQDPVLIREGEADDFELLGNDTVLDFDGGLGLLAGPEAVPVDKAHVFPLSPQITGDAVLDTAALMPLSWPTGHCSGAYGELRANKIPNLASGRSRPSMPVPSWPPPWPDSAPLLASVL
jgi:hypothetical protein